MKEHLHSFYIYGNSIFDKEKEEKRNAIRPIFFFDLDNTLYSKSSGIGELMGERITQFFQNYLKLPLEDSEYLGKRECLSFVFFKYRKEILSGLWFGYKRIDKRFQH